jgi:pimeloyl-[acyl-carrier protein] methyl ester esterase
MNWLLLRGLMREADHWGEFSEQLRSVPGVGRVICLDLPGIGTEQSKFFFPTVKQALEDLRSRFKNHEHDKNEDWGILGVSLGAMIAMQWVHDYPEDFKKIVVMNSSSRDFPIWKRLTFPSMKVILELFLEKDISLREKKIIDLTSNLRKNDLKLIDSWVKIANKNTLPSGFSKITAINQLAAAAQFKLPEKIKIPMLVLASRADRMVNYECSKVIAKKYKAPIQIHPTAGHDIAVDDSAWVVEQVSNWKL